MREHVSGWSVLADDAGAQYDDVGRQGGGFSRVVGDE
jgi:hypothetical protein